MCNIKKTILAAAMATVPFVAGAHDVPSIHMSGMSVSRTADGMLALTMDVNPAAFDMSRNREVLMTPVVYNADSTKTATYPPCITGITATSATGVSFPMGRHSTAPDTMADLPIRP